MISFRSFEALALQAVNIGQHFTAWVQHILSFEHQLNTGCISWRQTIMTFALSTSDDDCFCWEQKPPRQVYKACCKNDEVPPPRQAYNPECSPWVHMLSDPAIAASIARTAPDSDRIIWNTCATARRRLGACSESGFTMKGSSSLAWFEEARSCSRDSPSSSNSTRTNPGDYPAAD